MVKKTSINTKKVSSNNKSYLEKLENEVQTNQSKVSLVLGALIILVIGILVFNYFNRNKASLGPAQQSQTSEQENVSPDKLPGNYTVKEGDTLFSIAEKYYQDGYKYTEIAKANNLTNADQIEAEQVIKIPKLETQQAQASPEASAPEASVSAETQESLGTGGGNTTIWGPRIEGDKYTVVEEDWLSKIAGRAYGDISAFERIAKANNISNPDLIEPGTVLVIPR
ncbi:LysM peptidoglycan-binding domain-containing protein [Patescibacteria group bacterium]|nr:LysM peptidoglycan-binding domain-containing protein [Patescibacteria group bacterium]